MGSIKTLVNREVELRILEDEWRKRKFSMVMVYGRRRIGKSWLLTNWLRRHYGIYYTAAQLEYSQLSKEFSETVSRTIDLYVPSDDIIQALRVIADKINRRIAVVLDEYQYITESDPSFPSRLQRLIDTRLSQSKIMLVISGSAVSYFEKEITGYKAPLHGRRTSQIRLRPMNLVESWGFWPKMAPIEVIRSYSVIGGTPAYLALTRNATNSKDVLRKIYRPGSPLLEEAENILRQELREPRTYASILKAIATGRNSTTEAAQASGVDPRIINKYTTVLKDLDIIETIRPLGKRRPSRLRIIDPYFHYYYKQVTTLRNLVDTGHHEEAVEEAFQHLDEHVSLIFEQIIHQLVPYLYTYNYIDTPPVQVGSWWYKEWEIDLIVRNPGKSTTFIEVKWMDTTLKAASKILESLEDKAMHTGLQSPINHYILIARRLTDVDQAKVSLDNYRAVLDMTKVMKKLHVYKRQEASIEGS